MLKPIGLALADVVAKAKPTAFVIAWPGEQTDYYDHSRMCWTGHPHKATRYASRQEAETAMAALDSPVDECLNVQEA